MRADRPKPYLRLGDRYLIDVTLSRLLAVDSIDRIQLALHPEDRWWADTESASSDFISIYTGGAERDDSVRAGLECIRPEAAPDDWVLVHDVARPCVSGADIEALLAALAGSPVGGILAAPLVDTIKLVAEDGRIEGTADRRRLWRALTPQVFRFEVLDRALRQARARGTRITDEASAVEALGLQPLVVTGRSDNIKVTVPEDLALAAWFLAGLDSSSCQA
jgi:2-C-methyl-D-erythritol 4-phosphate cytidylyltransferase